MKGRGTQHKSPNELRTLSHLCNGVYVNPHDKEHIGDANHFIQKYFGAERKGNRLGHNNELPIHLVRSAFSKTNHKAVKAPRAVNPFQDPNTEAQFHTELARCLEECRIPEGYGVLKAEWRNLKGKAYPGTGSIVVGARKQKYELRMPVEVWLPRAQKWAIGLDLLERFLHALDVDQ
ncbi:hypothetical protein FRC09_003212 [Ceratobasidium sp. 395]|nr:hypothetical protein FRC09_003212 [Ceratobasidium sp. 395]